MIDFLVSYLFPKYCNNFVSWFTFCIAFFSFRTSIRNYVYINTHKYIPSVHKVCNSKNLNNLGNIFEIKFCRIFRFLWPWLYFADGLNRAMPFVAIGTLVVSWIWKERTTYAWLSPWLRAALYNKYQDSNTLKKYAWLNYHSLFNT